MKRLHVRGIDASGTPDNTTFLRGDGAWGTPSGGGGGTSVRDVAWAVPSTMTSVDEFNDDTLGASWARVDKSGGAGRATWTELADVLSVYNSGGDTAAELHAMVRSISSAPVAGDAYVTALTIWSYTQYTMGGIVLADGNAFGSGAQILALGHSNSPTQVNVNTRAFTGYQTQGSISGALGYTSNIRMFMRLVYLGSNNWRTDTSPDGVSWAPGATLSYTVVPTHVGIYTSSWGTGTKGVTSYDFLRTMSGVT